MSLQSCVQTSESQKFFFVDDTFFSKYGIVEHETVSIRGDLYMVFSNCPQALSTENGAAWIEEGGPVEQGKEAIQWMKVGYLLK